jgi:hypothetical protein
MKIKRKLPTKKSFSDKLNVGLMTDENCKIIFDHFRNLAISAAVTGAGIYAYITPRKNPEPLIIFFALILVGMGVLLFFINAAHGLKKIFMKNSYIFTKLLVALLIYCATFVAFQQYVLKAAGVKSDIAVPRIGSTKFQVHESLANFSSNPIQVCTTAPAVNKRFAIHSTA